MRKDLNLSPKGGKRKWNKKKRHQEKDILNEINASLKLMAKARKIAEEYSKIFSKIGKKLPEDLPLSVKWRLDAEVKSLQIHKNIISMVSEVLENNNIKQNQDIINYHVSSI